jgi:hypothetical protein
MLERPNGVPIVREKAQGNRQQVLMSEGKTCQLRMSFTNFGSAHFVIALFFHKEGPYSSNNGSSKLIS